MSGPSDRPDWLEEILEQLRKEFASKRPPGCEVLGGTDEDLDSSSRYFAIEGRRRFARHGSSSDSSTDISSEDDDTASFSGVEVTLRQHLEGVEKFAGEFGRRAGLSEAIVSDLALAGAWHDAGKADRRFQILLHNGSRFRAETAPEPIAKSSMRWTRYAARRQAHERSGYPKGGRHELVSVRFMELSEKLETEAKDLDLVLHLVASHHGRCRPFAPIVLDEHPEDVALSIRGEKLSTSSRTGLEAFDSGVSDRFWRLVRRYGWYGIAWLEAIFRLADHRRSEAEHRLREKE